MVGVLVVVVRARGRTNRLGALGHSMTNPLSGPSVFSGALGDNGIVIRRGQ